MSSDGPSGMLDRSTRSDDEGSRRGGRRPAPRPGRTLARSGRTLLAQRVGMNTDIWGTIRAAASTMAAANGRSDRTSSLERAPAAAR